MKTMRILVALLSVGTAVYATHDSKGHAVPAGIQQGFLSLEAIDFTQLELVKTSHLKNGGQRKVYRSIPQGLYYKVWSVGYSRADDFVRAFNDGVYDELACLVAVIYDKDTHARGYVTKMGMPVDDPRSRVVMEEVPGTLGGKPYTFKFFADLEHQVCPKFKVFYKQLLNVMEEKGYFFFDLQPFNVIMVDGHYKLIDLEAVAPLADLRDEFYTTYYNPKDYREAVRKLTMKRVQRSGA